jgi:hypothetical protein
MSHIAKSSPTIESTYQLPNRNETPKPIINPCELLNQSNFIGCGAVESSNQSNFTSSQHLHFLTNQNQFNQL